MSSKIHYISYGSKTDGTNYCSGLETFADNLIEENEENATVVFPDSNAWITPRNADESLLTTDNAQIVMPSNIYKIVKLWYALPVSDETKASLVEINAKWKSANGKTFSMPSLNMSMVYYAKTGELYDYKVDFTDRVKTKEEYLSLQAVKKSDVGNDDNRHNTLYYSQGDNKIFIGENAKGLLGGVAAAFDLVLARWFATRPKNWMQGELGIYVTSNGTVGFGAGDGELYYLDEVTSLSLIGNYSADPREQKFQVEYVPMRAKEKIRARKTAKTEVDFFQPFNQRAEIVEASAFGKSMSTTAQKTGVKELTIVKRYSSLKDIPPIGAKVKHNGRIYRVSSNSYSMTNTTYIQVVHSLSENWTMKSNHVAVDQKFRNWAIPMDVLERTLYHEEFLHISKNQPNGTDEGNIIPYVMNIFENDIVDDKTASQMYFYPLGKNLHNDYVRVVSPCSAYGLAGSMIISAGFSDSLFCGARIDKYEGNTYCEPVQYCFSDGSLERVSITISNAVKNGDVDLYPAVTSSYNLPDESIFSKSFIVLKDAGEALKFTYQAHIVADDNDIIVGAKFAELCPLVKKWTSNRTIKAVTLDREIIDGEEKVHGVASYALPESKVSTLNGVGTLAVAGIFKLNDLTSAKAWAIVDGENNLLVGCNDTSVTTLYFTISKDK